MHRLRKCAAQRTYPVPTKENKGRHGAGGNAVVGTRTVQYGVSWQRSLRNKK